MTVYRRLRRQERTRGVRPVKKFWGGVRGGTKRRITQKVFRPERHWGRTISLKPLIGRRQKDHQLRRPGKKKSLSLESSKA